MACRSIRPVRVSQARRRSGFGKASGSRGAITPSAATVSLHSWPWELVSQTRLVCGRTHVLSRTLGKNGSNHHGICHVMPSPFLLDRRRFCHAAWAFVLRHYFVIQLSSLSCDARRAPLQKEHENFALACRNLSGCCDFALRGG